MTKQLIKLCLASILSLSLNTGLKAQEITPPIPATQESTVTENTLSEIESFIHEAQTNHPNVRISFSAQNGEIIFESSSWSRPQGDEEILESLGNQEWIGSLKSFKMVNVEFNSNSSLLPSVLAKMTNLQSLILNNTNLNSMEENGFKVFANTLSTLPNLQKLDVGGNHLKDKLTVLVSAITNMPNLNELSLSNNISFGSLGINFEQLANDLSPLTNLHVLNLELNILSTRLELFAPAIANMTNLKVLILRSVSLESMNRDKFKTFANALSSLTKLQQLDLHANELGERIGFLAPALLKMTDLRMLNLGGNHLEAMTTDSLKKIANALSSRTKLEVLNLTWNNLKEKFALLAPALANMTNLKELLLGHNNLGVMSVNSLKTLAQYLSSLTNLQRLYLRYNSLGKKFALLAPALARMTNLQILDLGCNDLGTMELNSLKTFAGYLSSLTKLQKLNLSCNDLQEEFSLLTPAFAKMTDLRDLSLYQNNLNLMTWNDFGTFLKHLSKLTKLQSLELGNNHLGEMLVLLPRTFANMTDFQSLSLTGNNLGSMDQVTFDTFAKILSHLTNLQYLNLKDNNLGRKFTVLISPLANMPRLQNLNLEQNNLWEITPDGWQAFTEVLSVMPNLQTLNLGANMIQGSTLNTFISAIFETESIAGIPNLMNYSDSEPPKATHFLRILLHHNSLRSPYNERIYTQAALQASIDAYNPRIELNNI